MSNQKLENLLNLALEASLQEREKSQNLNVGYEQENNSWELIVKYHGDLSKLHDTPIQIENLIAGYAIVTLPQTLIRPFSELDEVEFIEKPKRLYFNNVNIEVAKGEACILPVTLRPPNLSGRGVLIGIIDSGIDYANPAFLNSEGKSRIYRLWDQTIEQAPERGFTPPEGFRIGVEFTNVEIDEAIALGEKRFERVPSRDISGHGTAVGAIAAGSRIEESETGKSFFGGVAQNAELIVVRLGTPKTTGFPRTTELMRALTYVVKKAIDLQKPVAINLSFGNTYGNHEGDSILERFIDNVSQIGRTSIVVGSGNEGASLGHSIVKVSDEETVELSVGQYERTLNLQMWFSYEDDFKLEITSPGGITIIIDSTKNFARETGRGNTLRRNLDNVELLIYVGEPLPYSVSQEIYIDFLPTGEYVPYGIWKFRFIGNSIRNGIVKLYLPSDVTRSEETFFFLPTPEVTLTIPSTAQRVITVGAYNTQYKSYADFSGRGFVYSLVGGNKESRQINSLNIKPDLVAPGVLVETVSEGGQTTYVTGTSFATPFVTGSVALMMEWGIVKKNDIFLYGEKIKAYLQKGAKPLPGFTVYPNALVGFGALCLRDSIPLL